MEGGSPWFVHCGEQPKSAARLRLFCFHYAGGGGSMFGGWTRWLMDGIELVAVQLPGRENRIDEALVYSMELIISPLVEAIAPLLERPFAFFGHSTGAMICFELARELRRRSLPEPRLLVVSGQDGPRCKPPVIRHRLSDPEFIEVLRGCRGTPDVILESPVLLELLLPRIRADGAIYETYCYAHEAPLDCRIVVFHGRDDTLVTGDGLAAWGLETRGDCERFAFPGSHFFLHPQEEAVVEQINRELSPCLVEGEPLAQETAA